MIFVKKSTAQKQGFNIAILLRHKEVKGHVGIEIECEGNKFEKENVPSPWGYHHDGSLRGKDNAEYVLKKPIDFSAVPSALEKLWAMFEETGTVLDESNRTSVHVHVNCQDFYMDRLTSFLATYYVLEEVLTQWCGELRVGNLFCLRAKDAPAIITQVRQFIRTDGRATLKEGIHHYAALNTSALHKFGSVEFRTLRGVTEPSTILEWVNIIERLYLLSAEFTDPRSVCDAFSSEGPLAFFEYLLGDQVNTVRKGISWSDEQIRESMYEGIRMAQDLCYCRDWSEFNPMELKSDPFGRSSGEVAEKIMAAEAFQPAPAVVEYFEEEYYDPDEDFD